MNDVVVPDTLLSKNPAQPLVSKVALRLAMRLC